MQIDRNKTIYVGYEQLTIEALESYLNAPCLVKLHPEAAERVNACRQYLDDKVAKSDRPLYGITTGFGSLCNVSIEEADLTRLQENLIKSHACSLGNEVCSDIVRLMLLLKAHALGLGHSGVQLATIELILDLLNADVLPVVYDRGSLGASGDLAPLAKLFLPLIAEGEVRFRGELRKSAEVLNELGLKPIQLKSKEGLALLNGTQFMSSHGVWALIRAERLIRMSDYVAALSLDAFMGLAAPFTPQLHEVRPHKGQQIVSKNMLQLLKGSQIQDAPKTQVQDPYSFRCIPQVHGASRDALAYVRSVILTEINSVTDNPTIFPEDDLIVSGGNFHGQPLALVYDFLALAMAELGNISDRRVAQLIFGLRGLPEFLVAKPGLNSGMMIPQYAGAAMVSQNKMYCFAAASDSIVSSNGQEDHVSMGANAAVKLLPLLDNLERILGIELLNAAQAVEFRRPLRSSDVLETLVSALRAKVDRVEDDVVMYEHIEAARQVVASIELPDYL